MPGAQNTEGRLFMNGQVFSYRSEGTPENYWTGTQFVSVHLRGVEYKMNLDRPPVNQYDFKRYAKKLVDSMNREELIEQVKLTERIWTADIE